MAHLYRLVLALVLLCAGVPAFAAGTTFTHVGKQAQCSLTSSEQSAAAGAAMNLCGNSGVVLTQSSPSCKWVCQSNGESATLITKAPILLCPQLSTEVPGDIPPCKCDPGTKPSLDGTQCVEDETSDKKKCAVHSALWNTVGGGYSDEMKLPGKIDDGGVYCMGVDGLSSPSKGCQVKFKKSSMYSYGEDKWFSEGTFDTFGDADDSGVDRSCTQGPENTIPKDEKCKDGYSGTVNGVEVCVPKPVDNGTETPDDEEEEEDNGTETKKTKRSKTTTCDGKVCTTTTITTITITNNNNGSSTTSSSSKTDTESLASFCAKNASSAFCKGSGNDKPSAFSGSCTAGYECSGDAIQCAIARQQHKQWCELNAETDEAALYADAKTKTGSVTGDLEGNKDVDIMDFMSAQDFLGLGGGSCIPDKDIQVMGQSITIPYSSICPYLQMLGAAMVLVSCITAARIVTRKA